MTLVCGYIFTCSVDLSLCLYHVYVPHFKLKKWPVKRYPFFFFFTSKLIKCMTFMAFTFNLPFTTVSYYDMIKVKNDQCLNMSFLNKVIYRFSNCPIKIYKCLSIEFCIININIFKKSMIRILNS